MKKYIFTLVLFAVALTANAQSLFNYSANLQGEEPTEYSNRQFQTIDAPDLGESVGLKYDGSAKINLEILRRLQAKAIDNKKNNTANAVEVKLPVEEVINVDSLIEVHTATVKKYDSLVNAIDNAIQVAFDTIIKFRIDTVFLKDKVSLVSTKRSYNDLTEGDTISCVYWRNIGKASVPRELFVYRDGSWHQINPHDLEVNADILPLRKMTGKLGKTAFIIQDLGGYVTAKHIVKPGKQRKTLKQRLNNIKYHLTPACKYNKARNYRIGKRNRSDNDQFFHDRVKMGAYSPRFSNSLNK